MDTQTKGSHSARSRLEIETINAEKTKRKLQGQVIHGQGHGDISGEVRLQVTVECQ